MKNILIVVDPQNDFITGSLAVEGAEEKMLKLAKYLKEKHHIYDAIYVTLDNHFNDHCSFKENGGIWPKHCVAQTYGNAIYQPLYLMLSNDKWLFKGIDSQKEEYSVFENKTFGIILKNDIENFLEKDNETFIDVCGIAGDYCVLETIKDLTKIINNKNISILEEFTPSIDGGEKLLEYAKSNDINVIYNSEDNLNEYNNNKI